MSKCEAPPASRFSTSATRIQEFQTIRSGTAEIALHYDEHRRIVRARGSHGQEVGYEYDAGGRLMRVIESSGVVRRYSYDDRGAMLTIDEPRWHIENSYDADGRCVRQVTRWPNGRRSVMDVAYKVGEGGITETTTSWNGGPKTVYHFGDDHYLESKELDPTGPAPVVVLYLRTAGATFSTGVTIRCYDAQKRVLRTADGDNKGEEATDEMAARTCHEWARSTEPPDDPLSEPAAPDTPPASAPPAGPAIVPGRTI